MKNKRKIGICLSIFSTILAIVCFVSANYVDKAQKMQYKSTYNAYMNLFSSNNKSIPKENLTKKEINDVKKDVNNIAYAAKKQELEKKLDELEDYVTLRDNIDKSITGDVLNSDVSIYTINSFNVKNKKLPKKYQNLLEPKITIMYNQMKQISDTKDAVKQLFSDDNYEQVKSDVTRDSYNNVVLMQQSLKQKDIANEQQKYLEKVNSELTRREEEERKRQEEERRRQEEERKRQIQAAWSVLNVPYISQNKNGVLNGCEAASLLMGLQYKGYLQGIDLATYATNMPKSTDPFQGFTYDIFGLAPTNVPHWIAPSPLAQYGRSSSGNNGVIDATGKSLDELDSQIQAGNPVVIYLTGKLKSPKAYIENAPKNIHVLLLTGYNAITKEQIITDPWTHDDGRTKWQVSKETVEKIYNATGKRAVIIS